MNIFSLSLRKLLFFVVGTLSILVMVLSGMSAFDAWDQRAIAEEVVEDNELTDSLLTAGRLLIEERDITATVLQTIEKGATGRNLSESRGRADDILRKAIRALRSGHTDHSFGNKNRVLGEMERLSGQLGQHRATVDEALRKVIDKRDPAVLQSWNGAMTTLDNATRALWLAASRGANHADAVTGNFSQLKQFAWIIADYAGRERAILAGMIFEDLPMAPQQLRVLSDYRGRVELAWDSLKDAKIGRAHV